MKNIVVLLADGFEEIEALTPVDYLRRAGDNVTLLAVKTSSVLVTSSHKVRVTADMMLDSYLDSIGNELPDAIVVPGGIPGSPNIASTPKAISLLNEMFEKGKLVTAICAAPAVVLGAKTKILEGKKWTCYPNMQNNAPDYENNHVDQPFVVSGNVITSRGAGAAEQFAMEIIRYLHDDETVEKIKKATVQR